MLWCSMSVGIVEWLKHGCIIAPDAYAIVEEEMVKSFKEAVQKANKGALRVVGYGDGADGTVKVTSLDDLTFDLPELPEREETTPVIKFKPRELREASLRKSFVVQGPRPAPCYLCSKITDTMYVASEGDIGIPACHRCLRDHLDLEP